jgi:riboflavin kinase/FMN adenylyltransferase
VFTFDPHPATLLRPDAGIQKLVTADHKLELLEQLGVDAVITFPTDRQFLELSAGAFFENIVLSGLGAGAIVEGPDFAFGKNREGTIEQLGKLCTEQQIVLEVVEPVEFNGEVVSSSRLRRLVGEGELKTVNQMLTSPFRIRGKIQRGSGRGEQLGFPTANLAGVETLLPGDGVYAGCGYIDGQCWPAAVNIGTNPTFDEETAKLEVHLVGFSGSRYGEMIDVQLLERLRDVRRFENAVELQSQIEADVDQACQLAKQVPGMMEE